MTAAEAECLGEEKLFHRIEEINQTLVQALDNNTTQANSIMAAFDGASKFEWDLQTFEAFQYVQLKNKSHTKGATCWLGPFEFNKVLDNNMYFLIDQVRKE